MLRKLELEGNNLGPKSAKEFGKALRVNKTLQFLDLESNQLTADGEDNPGVIELIASLEHNTTLLSLNLANNKLEGPIGSAIKAMLDKNHTLIDLEVGFNSFSIADVSLLLSICRQGPFKSHLSGTKHCTTLSDLKSGEKGS